MIPENYIGITFAISASILWSITVVTIKPITNQVSPFLINPIKNSIGFFYFLSVLFYLTFPYGIMIYYLMNILLFYLVERSECF